MNFTITAVLIAIGIFSYWLGRDGLSLSQRAQKRFPRWVDMIILIFGYICWVQLFLWLESQGNPVWEWNKGAIYGSFFHVFWANKERWEK